MPSTTREDAIAAASAALWRHAPVGDLDGDRRIAAVPYVSRVVDALIESGLLNDQLERGLVPLDGNPRSSERCPNGWACLRHCACHRLKPDALAADLAQHYELVTYSYRKVDVPGGQ